MLDVKGSNHFKLFVIMLLFDPDKIGLGVIFHQFSGNGHRTVQKFSEKKPPQWLVA